MGRILESWIDSFVEWSQPTASPEVFRRWTGYAIIAGALERKVWVETFETLYPNIYIFLIGPPAVGKTLLTHRARELMIELKEHHVAHAGLTKAAMIDDLREAERKLFKPAHKPPMIQFNSMSIISNEMGSLFGAYDETFMSALTDLWDCRPYGERRRSTDKNTFVMEAPQLNMLVATTPAHLRRFLPEGAWDQGFLSRVIMVFSGPTGPRPLFSKDAGNEQLKKNLIEDLKKIGDLFGELRFSKTAIEVIETWNLAGAEPVPTHPRLMHYNSRRVAHVLKLTIIAAVSMGEEKVITEEHFNIALEDLIAAETLMPDIYRSMTVGTDAQVIEEVWHWMFDIYRRTKQPIYEKRIHAFLGARVPVYNVARFVEVMEASGLIKRQIGESGNSYIPMEYNRE